MRQIIKILRVEDRGKYKITHALFDDGTEASAYTPDGEEFKIGDECEVFFHEPYNQVKFRRTPK